MPSWVAPHAAWAAEVAGDEQTTGAFGRLFLHRLGQFVDGHMRPLLTDEENARMAELMEPDLAELADAIASGGFPPAPPADWPQTSPSGMKGPVAGRIGILGDIHIGSKHAAELVPAAISQINRLEPDAAVAIGDLTQNGSREFFQRAHETLRSVDAPLAVTLGNHDMWGGAESRPLGRTWFKESFAVPSYGVHQHDGFALVVIDSSDPRPSPFPPFDLLTGGFLDQPNESVPGGSFSPEVLSWLEEVETQGPTLMFLHHPPHPYLAFPPLVFGLDENSTRALSDAARRLGAMGIVCGHTHRSVRYELDGVPVLEVPSTKEWPFGFGMIEIGASGWSFNLVQIDSADLVETASTEAGVLFRRYARGEDEARSFVIES